MVTAHDNDVPSPFREAFEAFRDGSPAEFAQERANFRWEVFRKHLLPEEQRALRSLDGCAATGSVPPELHPVLEALASRPDAVEDFFVVLWNVLISQEDAKVERDWRLKSERNVWTRHHRQVARDLAAEARDKIAADPSDADSVVRLGPDVEVGDGFVASGVMTLRRLAQGGPGRGEQRNWSAYDRRWELMRFLTSLLDLSVEAAAAATAELLRIYAGTDEKPQAIRVWWYNLPRR